MTYAEAIEAIHANCELAIDMTYDYHQDDPESLDLAINKVYSERDTALKELRRTH